MEWYGGEDVRLILIMMGSAWFGSLVGLAVWGALYLLAGWLAGLLGSTHTYIGTYIQS